MIEQFMIDVPAVVVNELHDRLRCTCWSSGVTDSGGLALAEAQRLTSFWIDSFDWYERQARLNLYRSSPRSLATRSGYARRDSCATCASSGRASCAAPHGSCRKIACVARTGSPSGQRCI